jgi:hypothetical protein
LRLVRLTVSAAAAFAVLAATASASTFELSVERQTSEHRMKFVLECSYYPCDATAEVFRHGRRVLREDMTPIFEDDPDYLDEIDDPDYGTLYDWACGRTGLHRFRLTVTTAASDDDSVTQTTETRQGSFRVGRCGKWRPRRVSRGYAADDASGGVGGWGNEFVSSVRCSPRGAVIHGRSSAWRCLVTHNNTYRECTSPLTTRFQQRLKFGRTIRRERESYGRDHCSYF